MQDIQTQESGNDTTSYPPKFSRRHRRNGPSLKTTIVAISAAVVVGGGAMIANSLTKAIPSLSNINPNPGQELGDTTFSDAQVEAFEVSGVDVIGTAELTVNKITQELIDKREIDSNGKKKGKERVHETLVFDKAKFLLSWENPGSWKANKVEDGMEITLPNVVASKKISVIKSPKLNEEKTNRAFWQSAAGVFGASDTQASDFSDAINSIAENIGKDTDIVGDHMRSTACAALASAGQKAQAISEGLGIQADIQTYIPTRELIKNELSDVRKPNGNSLRKIRFKIQDPTNKDRTLTIESCAENLDNIGFNTGELKSPDNPKFGLLSVSIDSRTLQPREQ